MNISELIHKLEELRTIHGDEICVSVAGVYGSIGNIEDVIVAGYRVFKDEVFIISDITSD